MDRLTCTVSEAARMLGIGRSVAWRELHAGKIPSLRLGKRIVVPLAALEKMLECGSAGASV